MLVKTLDAHDLKDAMIRLNRDNFTFEGYKVNLYQFILSILYLNNSV